MLHFKTVAFVFENQSNKITTDSLTNCWFFASIIYNIYADFNHYNTRNYQLMWTLTTLQKLFQHTSNKVTTKVSLDIFVKHTHTYTCTHTRTHAHACTHTHTHPHARSYHWWRWKNRTERHEMFVAGAPREQKSSEGGLQRLEFKKNNLRALCQFPFSDDFLLHTPWWLILSVGSFSYSPMLLYMGSVS